MKNIIKTSFIIYIAAIVTLLRANFAFISLHHSHINNVQSINYLVKHINQDFTNIKNSSSPVLAAGIITGEVAAGFTLAEVMITLLVIGVVSSIVIPQLIQNTNNAEYKTAYKKIYADFSQAAKRLASDNGGQLPITYSIYGYDFTNTILPYFSYTKYCGTYNDDSGTCFHKRCEFYTSEGTAPCPHTHIRPKFILNNGMLVQFIGNGSSYWVDLNGFKGPNRRGTDICTIEITANGNVRPDNDCPYYLTQ